MQSRKHEMPRLGGVHGGLEGFAIAHLAHEDHIRILPQGGLEAGGEVGHVDTHLALAEAALLVGEEVFDRILQRDHVQGLRLVEVAQHRRQRGTLPGAGGTADEDQPLVAREQRAHRLGVVVERGEIGRVGLHQAQGHGRLAALHVGVDAVTPVTGGPEVQGVVDLTVGEPTRPERGGDGRLDEVRELGGGEGRHLRLHQLPGDPHQGGAADLEVEVARGMLHGEGEEVGEDRRDGGHGGTAASCPSTLGRSNPICAPARA